MVYVMIVHLNHLLFCSHSSPCTLFFFFFRSLLGNIRNGVLGNFVRNLLVILLVLILVEIHLHNHVIFSFQSCNFFKGIKGGSHWWLWFLIDFCSTIELCLLHFLRLLFLAEFYKSCWIVFLRRFKDRRAYLGAKESEGCLPMLLLALRELQMMCLSLPIGR